VRYKSLGVIGSGKGSHFQKSIEPVLKKGKFFKIEGFLKKKSLNRKKYFAEKEFFKKKFDFVYIACPSQLHEKYIIKSLNAGFNVICEKPFVTKSKNLKKIIKLAKKNKKLIFECFMYAYHPVFLYIKKLIKTKKFGTISYVSSNFRYPSLKKDDNKYSKKLGNGFFYDTAVYPISLESYLFKFKGKPKIYQKILKNNVDLKGYVTLESNLVKRFYFWGEGQNYSNNLEIFFKNASIFVHKFYSKKPKEIIFLKINTIKKSFTKKFENSNHFELMFKTIKKNYKKNSFLRKNRELIYNQSKLLDLIRFS